MFLFSVSWFGFILKVMLGVRLMVMFFCGLNVRVFVEIFILLC